jgi:bile acid:Na+ symporter, BASS family
MSLVRAILLVLKVSIFLSVLTLGLHATFRDATSLFRRPGDLVRALLSMNVAMPAFALVLATMFHLHPAVKIALVVLSVSPVPPLFPHTAVKKGCGENYAVGLLVAMALLSIVVIPLTMEAFERLVGIPLQMLPRSVAALVLRTIFVPVLLGIGIRRMAPSFAERAARPLGIFAAVLLIASVLPVLFVSSRTLLSLIGNGTILAFAVFAVTGLITGYVFAGSELEKKRVLAMASSARHPGIAAAIAHANFPQQKQAVPAIILYLIISGILASIAMKRHKREKARTETEKRWAA